MIMTKLICRNEQCASRNGEETPSFSINLVVNDDGDICENVKKIQGGFFKCIFCHDVAEWINKEEKIMIKDPEIRKSFICSTGHISEEDDKILTKLKNENYSGIYECEHVVGYKIFVDLYDDIEFEDFIEKSMSVNLSKEFCNLLRISKDLGCNCLVLDADGKFYDELPKFDW